MDSGLRDALVGHLHPMLQAHIPDCVVVYDNAPFDWHHPPQRFMTIEIEPFAAHPLGCAAHPKTRLRGYVYVTTYAPLGEGTAWAMRTLTWLASQMQYQSWSPVQLETVQPVRLRAATGFDTRGFKCAFYGDV